MTVAFFDMDRTIIAVNSAKTYAYYAYQHGKANLLNVIKAIYYILLYRLNLIDVVPIFIEQAKVLKGNSETELILFCQTFVQDKIIPYIFKEIVKRIQLHHTQGHSVVIISSSTSYLIKPLADYLNIKDILYSQLEVHEDIFTGEVILPVCYGAGKVHWAEKYLSERHLSFEQSFFYTDSMSDLPLLLKVKYPVIVNPDTQLKRYAKRKQWPILSLSHTLNTKITI